MIAAPFLAVIMAAAITGMVATVRIAGRDRAAGLPWRMACAEGFMLCGLAAGTALFMAWILVRANELP